MDFPVAKKESSKRNRVGDWGSKRNWEIDVSSFSIQRFVMCYYLNFNLKLQTVTSNSAQHVSSQVATKKLESVRSPKT